MMRQKKRKPVYKIMGFLLAGVLLFLPVYLNIAGTSAAPANAAEYYINGRTANYKYSDANELYNASGIAAATGAGVYDSPIIIRKTVEQLTGSGLDERDFELMLTATGYDWETVSQTPVNIVFVIDATSSMGIDDVPGSATVSTPVKRWAAAFDAANAYIDALYETSGGRTIETAIVSFGKSARVHFEAGQLSGGTGIHTDIAGLRTGMDNFIGNYVVNSDPGNGRIHDSVRMYNDAVGIYAAFTSAYSNTAPFFYSDPNTLTGIVDRISPYSDTNIESGLLMADYLLSHKPNYSEAVNIVMLITDGEANSSSTLSMLENHPDLVKAVWGNTSGDGYGHLTLENAAAMSDPNEKYSALMNNTAVLSADAGFVNHLYSTLGSINFFTGVYHNLDRDEPGVRLDPNYVFPAQSDDTLGLYARHLFWLAETGTTYNIANSSIDEFDVFTDYKNGRFATLTSLFYEGGQFIKHSQTRLLDYEEHSGSSGGRNQNECGSVAAKRFMLNAADNLHTVVGATIYTTGIGAWVVDPGTLGSTASGADRFYICSSTSATINNAEALKREFEALGMTHSLNGVRELTITDVIPRRPDGAGDIDDDTFAVESDGVKARLWYYDANGDETATPWRNYSIADPDWTLGVSPDGTATTVSYNFGTLYSEEVARELDKRSPEYPFKVELRIQIRANDGVVSAAANNIPDIDTNTSARVDWRDVEGAQHRPYPVPKVYFAPPGGTQPPYIPPETQSPSPSPSPSPTDDPEDSDEPDDPDDPYDTEEPEDPDEPEETEEPYYPFGPDEPGPPPYISGGSDPEIPPLPSVPGGELVLDGDGWIEFDELGVPLGRWEWDDEEEMWIFDPFPPLGEMPQTGANSKTHILLLALGLPILGAGVVLRLGNPRKQGLFVE